MLKVKNRKCQCWWALWRPVTLVQMCTLMDIINVFLTMTCQNVSSEKTLSAVPTVTPLLHRIAINRGTESACSSSQFTVSLINIYSRVFLLSCTCCVYLCLLFCFSVTSQLLSPKRVEKVRLNETIR